MTMTTFTGTIQVAAYRLLSLRAQLRLEALGLKSSGGAIRPRIAKEFGLTPQAPYADYLTAITAKYLAL